MSVFSVTLNYHCHYGYVDYNSEAKTVAVVLDEQAAKKRVEDFFQKPLTLDVQEGNEVRNFVTKTLEPLASLENFKNCLTRLWVETDVLVEWSMPVER